jgi:hypothetical protein
MQFFGIFLPLREKRPKFQQLSIPARMGQLAVEKGI